MLVEIVQVALRCISLEQKQLSDAFRGDEGVQIEGHVRLSVSAQDVPGRMGDF